MHAGTAPQPRGQNHLLIKSVELEWGWVEMGGWGGVGGIVIAARIGRVEFSLFVEFEHEALPVPEKVCHHMPGDTLRIPGGKRVPRRKQCGPPAGEINDAVVLH